MEIKDVNKKNEPNQAPAKKDYSGVAYTGLTFAAIFCATLIYNIFFSGPKNLSTQALSDFFLFIGEAPLFITGLVCSLIAFDPNGTKSNRKVALISLLLIAMPFLISLIIFIAPNLKYVPNLIAHSFDNVGRFLH